MTDRFDPALMKSLLERVLSWADDEMILAHRNSEWTGHGPILEEDIAFSNIAQDELGHATLWYGIVQELSGEDPDRLVFFRDADAFRNVQMVEQPNGDWAFSMLRQYLFDAAELAFLNGLVHSRHDALREVAAKIQREEIYHLRHTHNWVKRLGLGTEESRKRMQLALEKLWPLSQQLFAPLPGEELLVEHRITPSAASARDAWLGMVSAHLEASGLVIPDDAEPAPASRNEHTPHLTSLLAEMQMVARLFPNAQW
jgi:ring-1,2-phenylacetyl-CoA epoxidase subunit PaaC